MRLALASALLALGLLGQAQTVPVTFAWDLDPTHDGAVTWEVEADGVSLPCGDVQVTSEYRRCTAQIEPGEYTFLLRGTASSDEGPLVGGWSKPVEATIAPPGPWTITAHFESRQDMSISLVGADSVGTSSITIPTHQAGDLLIICAYRNGSTVAPAIPSPWIQIASNGGNNNAMSAGYQIASGSGTGSGTWTNGHALMAHVYRGHDADTPIGAASATTGNSATITYPSLTLEVTNGSSWVVGCAGHRSSSATDINVPPTGMTNRTAVADSQGGQTASHDTNGGTSSWAGGTVNVTSGGSGWRSLVFEIRAATGGLNVAILNHYYRQMQGN